jgi:ubiquinone/menaquinone biosynthesis C-methylase UbiE
MSPGLQIEDQWDENAAAYDRFCSSYSLYHKSSRLLVEFSSISPGMAVVDLGCGTGATTAAILERLNNAGSVLAVDISEIMLQHARRRIDSPCVRFCHGPAEELDRLISEPVDRILSNYAFFQFTGKEQVLAAVGRALKPGGLFVFNSAPQDEGVAELPGSDLLQDLVFRARQSAGSAPAGQSHYGIEKKTLYLDSYGLRLSDTKICSVELSERELLAFYAIPCMGSFLLGLPQEQLAIVISAAERNCEGRPPARILHRQAVAIVQRIE